MTLNFEDRTVIVNHRLQRAKETLQEAKAVAELRYLHAAVNRLYYACYYAASALLIHNGHLTRTHQGVIGLLNLHFVSKELLSKEQGKFYGKLFELRLTGDYNDWAILEEEDVLSKIAPAEEFINSIEKLILD